MKLRIKSSTVGMGLVMAGLIALASFVAITVGPTGEPAPTRGPITSSPVSMPSTCGRAYELIAPALRGARTALSGILAGEQRAPHRKALEVANIALISPQGAPSITTAIIRCGVVNLDASRAYRAAREAVQGASIAANIIGDATLNPEAIAQLENDLDVIDHALAQH